MYCEGCVADMAEESEKIKCLECNVCDPRGFPKVCLILEQLLEENFPEEYKSRTSGIQKRLAHNSKGSKSYIHAWNHFVVIDTCHVLVLSKLSCCYTKYVRPIWTQGLIVCTHFLLIYRFSKPSQRRPIVIKRQQR